MPYTKKLITLTDLYQSGRTREPSLKALRARVDDKVPVFVEEHSAHYFDEELSVIRLQAARKCKIPKIKWSHIKRAFEALDQRELNTSIIERLNEVTSEAAVIDWVTLKIRNAL